MYPAGQVCPVCGGELRYEPPAAVPIPPFTADLLRSFGFGVALGLIVGLVYLGVSLLLF